MKLESLDGKTALITGASSGIGRETAKAFAEEGSNIALASRSKEELEEIAENLEAEYSVDTVVAPTDVTESEQVKQMIEKNSFRIWRPRYSNQQRRTSSWIRCRKP